MQPGFRWAAGKTPGIGLSFAGVACGGQCVGVAPAALFTSIMAVASVALSRACCLSSLQDTNPCSEHDGPVRRDLECIQDGDLAAAASLVRTAAAAAAAAAAAEIAAAAAELAAAELAAAAESAAAAADTFAAAAAAAETVAAAAEIVAEAAAAAHWQLL